jgi:hypothetical protein
VKGYPEPLAKMLKENSKQKFDKTFLEQRRVSLNDFLYAISSNQARDSIFDSKNGASVFMRFISPTQYGDLKPPGFVMPFKIELM